MSNIYQVSWSEIEDRCRQLASNLKSSDYKGILAVSRGGLVPACLLAQKLDIHKILTVSVTSYDDQNNPIPNLLPLKLPSQLNNFEETGEGWLVVDDLVDSGRTFKLIREALPEATYVTLYAKPDGVSQVDHYVADVDQDTWIYFPWEPRPDKIC